MRVVLAGAGGYIGRHVRRELLAAGAAVTTVGRSGPPGPDRHVVLDLAAPADPGLTAVIDGDGTPVVVVNCAGATGTDPLQLTAANIELPAALVAAAARAAPPVRLVHLGSAAEYGRVERGRASRETDPARPVGAYGMSKLAGTRIVESARALGLDAVVLRVTNPVGPGAPTTGLPGALAAEIRRARADGDAVRVGPLEAFRDFVDVRDVARAVVAAASAPTLTVATVNVGSGRATVAGELVEALVELSGYRGEVCPVGEASSRSAAVPWQQADVSLAAEVLGWRPRSTLRSALAALWTSTA
ncbi:NAD(P)-dependent oxidoreductase [Actinomycetes bacterium KLBMP 9759]